MARGIPDITEPMPVGVAIANALADAGATHVFGVPSESQLGLLDAIHAHDSLSFVATRHEEGAGFMAVGAARLNVAPGVAVAGRGPGATHLSIALHTAMQDNIPLVAIVGQVSRSVSDRNAFQEMDLVALARPMTKLAVEIQEPGEAGQLIASALMHAVSGRPGPVLVSVPEDVDRAETLPALPMMVPPVPPPDPGSVAAAAGLLASARSPVFIIGEGATGPVDRTPLTALAEKLAAGVYASWRRFDAFPNDHPSYLGNLPTMAEEFYAPLETADVLVLFGTRLDEYTSRQYRLPVAGQQTISIDVDADILAALPESAVSLQADPIVAAVALGRALSEHRPATETVRRLSELHRIYRDASTPGRNPRSDGYVDLEGLFATIRDTAPPHTVTTSDAGAFAVWLNRFYLWRQPRTFLGPMAGSMGYAVPAAVAGRLISGSPTLAFAGDGGFAMTMSEIDTAVRLGLGSLVFLVFNNRSYGVIERHQRSLYPESAAASRLGPVDFATVARGLGAEGYQVADNDEFDAVFPEALAADRPVVLDISMDPEVFSPWEGWQKDR